MPRVRPFARLSLAVLAAWCCLPSGRARSTLGVRPLAVPLRNWQIENGLPQNSVQALLQTARRLHLARHAGRLGAVRRRPVRGLRPVQHPRVRGRTSARSPRTATAPSGSAPTPGSCRYRHGAVHAPRRGRRAARARCARCWWTATALLWVGTERRRLPVAHGRVASADLPARPGRPSRGSRQAARRGHLVYGTLAGLYRFAGRQVDRFGRADGLPDETVYDVFYGSGGEIWAGTNPGSRGSTGGRSSAAAAGLDCRRHGSRHLRRRRRRSSSASSAAASPATARAAGRGLRQGRGVSPATT